MISQIEVYGWGCICQKKTLIKWWWWKEIYFPRDQWVKADSSASIWSAKCGSHSRFKNLSGCPGSVFKVERLSMALSGSELDFRLQTDFQKTAIASPPLAHAVPGHSLTGWISTTAFSLVVDRTVPCQGPHYDSSQGRNWERRPPV